MQWWFHYFLLSLDWGNISYMQHLYIIEHFDGIDGNVWTEKGQMTHKIDMIILIYQFLMIVMGQDIDPFFFTCKHIHVLGESCYLKL